MNKFKQMAVKAKRELENYRKQVREMSRSFVFFFFPVKQRSRAPHGGIWSRHNLVFLKAIVTFRVQWKEEKDELTSTIEGLKEDAQTLNEQFVKQQEEMLQQANEYKVNMIISKYLDESKMLEAFGSWIERRSLN